MPLTLPRGSESWRAEAGDMSRIQSAEIRNIRTAEGCTRLDHTRNGGFGEEVKIYKLD
jgi:hypothetical protein